MASAAFWLVTAACVPRGAFAYDVEVEGVGPVWMYPEELELLAKHLRQARTFFEFGMGASTLYISKEYPHLERLVSVDMDRRWVNRVRKHSWLRNGSGPAPKQISLLHIHIGRTTGYGFPLQNMSRCRHRIRLCLDPDANPGCAVKTRCYKDLIGRRSWWPPFSQVVLDAAAHFKHGWDVVLVDSRFRTACALKSLMAISSEAISRSVVMVHDYTIRRQHYQEIERFANMEEVVGSLAVFRKKPDFDPVALQHAVLASEYDPM
ncbi:unnamed protein product [Symbiodinium pilosum]|uniref:Uncharacterized protein n=1 Tax=Symbiodinium pilosum TaxID=2952 RepID=A0A812NR89_SYMPI|nr:unnamed protein product [Symbiodinium pilosum]